MAEFSQQNTPLRVFTPLPENTLLATALRGREEMGGTYSFQVDLIAWPGTPIDFSRLLGAEARVRLSLPGGAFRTYSGIIAQFGQRDGDQVFDRYTMVLRPAIHQLALVRRSRIYHQQSAAQIIDKLLEPVFANSTMKTRNFAGHTPVRTYCTQYRETDWDFLRRLSAESGVTWYWIHQPEVRTFKLTDNTSVGAPGLGTIHYAHSEGGTVHSTRIHGWQIDQSICQPGLEVLDHHFQVAGQEILGDAHPPETVRAGCLHLKPAKVHAPSQQDDMSSARFFDGVNPAGGHDASALPTMFSAAPDQAEIGMRGAMAGTVRAVAYGNCCQMAPGHSFTLAGHPNQDGEWVVVNTEHTVEVEGRFWAGEPCALRAEVRAECAPLSLRQAIWPVPPRPNIGGVLTGTVIGPAGQEIHLDKFGRVQVRFPWDRDNPSTSCWVRVAQSWAGHGWGACFWPRIGHEVVVAFENGDPDRPIVVGSVYNSDNMPPFPLPENRYIAGWKSLTEGGDPSKNFHQILMSDEKQGQVLHIHAEKTLIAQQESRQVSIRPNLDMTIQG